MPKFNFDETPVKKVAEEIRERHETIEQGGVAQPIPEVNQQMQTVAQPATPALQQTLAQSVMPVVEEGRAVSLGGPLVYNEATKGISVKLPYSLYDALDAIKKQTQRTGNPRDKMGIGDLVVLAVKEFVERNPVGRGNDY